MNLPNVRMGDYGGGSSDDVQGDGGSAVEMVGSPGDGSTSSSSSSSSSPSSSDFDFGTGRPPLTAPPGTRPALLLLLRLLPAPGSGVGAATNLCSATLGAGVLSLPFALSRTGIVPGLLLLALAAASTVGSIDLLVRCQSRTGLGGYEEMALALLGPGALAVAEASVFVFCFGTAVAYVVAVGDLWQEGVLDVFSARLAGAGLAWIDREICMGAFWLVVMLPLSLLRRVDSLRYASLVGIGSIVFLVGACVARSARDLGQGGGGSGGGRDGDGDARWWLPPSAEDVLLACPIVMFAFSCQVNVCAIYEELGGGGGTTSPRPGGKAAAMATVTRAAVAVCLTLYALIGTFAYADFGPATSPNVLRNYCVARTRDPVLVAAYAFVSVAIVSAFPLNVLPARSALEGRWARWNEGWRRDRAEREFGRDGEDLDRPFLVDDDDEGDDEGDGGGFHGGDGPPASSSDPPASPSTAAHVPSVAAPPPSSTASHVLFTLLISGGALLVALVVPDLSVVFGLMGGTASSVLCFVLPGLFVLRVDDGGAAIRVDDGGAAAFPSRKETAAAWALVVGGTAIGILSTAVTLYSTFGAESGGPPADVCGNER